MYLPNIPFEYFIFTGMLVGIAFFHQRALTIAVAGLIFTVTLKLLFGTFGVETGIPGLASHLGHEASLLANLFLLIVGFSVLASHFEHSNIPEATPRVLPSGWLGGLALLGFVFLLSSVLDNIAGAAIGGVIARHVYQERLGLGFLAAIIAAANAGGAGSVLGDTTTTMLWISGISPLTLARAFSGALVAFAVFATFAAWRQHRLSPGSRSAAASPPIAWRRVIVVAVILGSLLAVNLIGSSLFPDHIETYPWLGMGVWAAILLTGFWASPDWKAAREASKGALFLVALVATASLMPVAQLPAATWQTTFGLGAVSAVFDNIPLTALAINQGGYDWALLAYAVGFGGSMLWFGSSAGVVLAGMFPEIKSTRNWLKSAWPISVAYVAGFIAQFLLFGWNP